MGSRKEHWERLRGVFRACFCDGRTGQLHPAGAAVLQNLRDMCAFEKSAKRNDPHDTYYALGQQDVVKHIIQMIELNDEQLARLDEVVRSENQMEAFGLNDDNFN